MSGGGRTAPEHSAAVPDYAACIQTPSARSRNGLDWFNFFAADVRTGVGPFVAIYLTDRHWSLAQIGAALTAAEIAGVLTQAPGGALMDHIRSKRTLLSVAVVVLAASALTMAALPNLPAVLVSQVALGITGSIFGPGISALTLGLVTYACLGVRTGRNAAFGSAGNVIAVLTMGWIGFRFGTHYIFYFVAVLSIPTLLALSRESGVTRSTTSAHAVARSEAAESVPGWPGFGLCFAINAW